MTRDQRIADLESQVRRGDLALAEMARTIERLTASPPVDRASIVAYLRREAVRLAALAREQWDEDCADETREQANLARTWATAVERGDDRLPPLADSTTSR